MVRTDEVFEDVAKRAGGIIKGLRRLKVGESELCFCTAEQMGALAEMKGELESSYRFKADATRYGFIKIANLVNPGNTAHSYSLGLTSKYRTISRVESVGLSLPREFEAWKNTYRKKELEYAEVHGLEGDAYDHHIARIEHAITAARAQFEYVMEHFEDLEVLICGYENAKSYAQIVFYGEEGKGQKHLSVKAPNVLALELAPYRTDMKVAEIVKRGVNAFGEVYFMQKG